MSVLLKMASTQIESSGFKRALNAVHNQLINKVKDYKADEKIANSLTIFLNKILYPKYTEDIITNRDNKPLSANVEKYLTDELADSIRKQIGIYDSKAYTMRWQDLEKNVVEIFQLMIQGILAEAEKQSLLKTKDITTIKAKGTAQSSVPIDLSKLPQQVKDIVFQKIKESTAAGFSTKNGIPFFHSVQAKNDMLFLSSGIDTSKIPELAWLTDLSATMKNYSKNMKLERVNDIKAYTALINYLNKGRLGPRTISALYQYYVLEKPSDQVQSHLEHIKAIFALTGLGTEYVSVDALNFNYEIFSRFLIYRPAYASGSIHVVSTKSLIYEMLGGNNKFQFSQSAANEILNKKWSQQLEGYTYLNI